MTAPRPIYQVIEAFYASYRTGNDARSKSLAREIAARADEVVDDAVLADAYDELST